MTERRVLDFGNPWKYQQPEVGLASLRARQANKHSDSDAIIIDAGSWQYRAGYSNQDMPSLVFDPIVHRYQVKSGEPTQFTVGRTGPSGVSRTSSRSPYEEGNVILNFATLEHILDDIFTKLNIKNDHVANPVIMTEVIGNIPYCRQEVSELLFEGYGVGQAAYLVDGPLSLIANKPESLQNSLIISIGNYSTVLMVILGGKVRGEWIRRINFGGATANKMMLSLLLCKYPNFPVKLSPWQAEILVQQTAKVAYDYDAVLNEIASSDEALYKTDVTVQFPFITESESERAEKEAARERLLEKRREQAQKLREKAERVKMEKIEAKKYQIESMKRLAAKVVESSLVKSDGGFDDVEEEVNQNELHLFGYENQEELQMAIEGEERALNRLLGIEETREAPNYSLLDISDDQLNEEQVKEKRRQRLLKSSADAREKVRKEKEEAEARKEAKLKTEEDKRITDFEGWKREMYIERQEMMKILKESQKKKEALSDRRSFASNSRLKSVVSLVAEDDDIDEDNNNNDKKGSKKKKKTAKEKESISNNNGEEKGFGDDDADWLIYRKISKEEEGAEEAEEELNKRLLHVEAELEKYDNEGFLNLISKEANMNVTILDKLREGHKLPEEDPNATLNQIHLNVERFRVTEGLFQPGAILGIEQAGLTDAIDDLLKSFNIEERTLLLNNIFVTGGASQFDGLEDRLKREIQMLAPVELDIQPFFARDPHLDAWRGACLLARSHSESIPWISREWYAEHGGHRLPSTTWFTNQY